MKVYGFVSFKLESRKSCNNNNNMKVFPALRTQFHYCCCKYVANLVLVWYIPSLRENLHSPIPTICLFLSHDWESCFLWIASIFCIFIFCDIFSGWSFYICIFSFRFNQRFAQLFCREKCQISWNYFFILNIPVPISNEERKLTEGFILTLLYGATKGFMMPLKAFIKTSKECANKNVS